MAASSKPHQVCGNCQTEDEEFTPVLDGFSFSLSPDSGDALLGELETRRKWAVATGFCAILLSLDPGGDKRLSACEAS